VKGNILQCKNCGQDIYFDDEVLSQSGKKIPLDFDEENANPYPQYHDCPNNPYKKGDRGFSKSKVAVPNVNVSGLETKVQELSDRVTRLEAGLKGLGEAVGKLSFKSGDKL
jgi:hypothetical protein